MLLHPNKSPQIEVIIRELRSQEHLYNEAVVKDVNLSIKKEIRIKIKELQQQLLIIQDEFQPTEKEEIWN